MRKAGYQLIKDGPRGLIIAQVENQGSNIALGLLSKFYSGFK